MRLLIPVLLVSVSSLCSAQVQFGYVRTAGDTKKACKPLSKVTIMMDNGSAFVSGDDGSFALSVPYIRGEGESLPIVRIKKRGFELLDRDCISNGFLYSSSVPLEIVMISSAILEKTKAKIERRARSKATWRYRQERDKLDRLLKENAISLQRYRKEVEALDKHLKTFGSLISMMADRYARTDYGKHDSVNTVINECIVNVDLEKADSLINTKGNVVQRAELVIDKGRRLQDAKKQIDSIRITMNRRRTEFGDTSRE